MSGDQFISLALAIAFHAMSRTYRDENAVLEWWYLLASGVMHVVFWLRFGVIGAA